MKLTVIGPWPPYRGGIAHFTARLAQALSSRDHEVSGVSFSRQYPDLVFPGKSQEEPGEVSVDAFDAPRTLDPVNPRTWWSVGNGLRAAPPDALVFQHWTPFFSPAYGTVARRVVGREGRRPRRIAVVHNALPHERRIGDIALSRYFFRACDGLVALSSAVRDDLKRIAPGVPIQERSHPVYDQFGPAAERGKARRTLQLPGDGLVLLFFGFVRRYKGLDVLLDAMPAILARHPNAVLVVAGEFYEGEQQYRRQIERLGLGEHVRLENQYVSAEEVPLFFGAADVVVQPYRSATQSGVAQVAFGFGMPVITTDVGGLSESVPHERAGLVVPPEDPEALAEAVNRFLDDESLRDRLMQGAQQQRTRVGWDAVCQAIEMML